MFDCRRPIEYESNEVIAEWYVASHSDPATKDVAYGCILSPHLPTRPGSLQGRK